MSHSERIEEFNHDLLKFPPLMWVCFKKFYSIVKSTYSSVFIIMLPHDMKHWLEKSLTIHTTILFYFVQHYNKTVKSLPRLF